MDRLTGESQKRNRKLPTPQAIEPCDSKTVPTAEIDSRSSSYEFFTVDYVAANTPIIREQLQKSAVRLSHLLDTALSK